MQQARTKPQPATVSFWQFMKRDCSLREINSDNQFSFWFLNEIVLKDYPLNLEEAEIWQVNKQIDNFIILQPQSIVLISKSEIIDVGCEEIIASAVRLDFDNSIIQIFISSLIYDGEIVWEYKIRPVNERTVEFVHYLCYRIGEIKQQMYTPSTAIQE